MKTVLLTTAGRIRLQDYLTKFCVSLRKGEFPVGAETGVRPEELNCDYIRQALQNFQMVEDEPIGDKIQINSAITVTLTDENGVVSSPRSYVVGDYSYRFILDHNGDVQPYDSKLMFGMLGKTVDQYNATQREINNKLITVVRLMNGATVFTTLKAA